VLRAKVRQLDYLMERSGRVHWRFNRQMAISIDAARSSEREEDVIRAVTTAFGSPLTPPESWKDSREPEYR
jgi:hypothetical protein